jgi:GT2 family glycosyltransferase
VIIPFRDQWEITERCLNSIFNQTACSYQLSIVLANNQSCDPRTIKGIQEFLTQNRSSKITCFEYFANYPFNFSRINNEAFKKFYNNHYDFVIFMNNDVELIDVNFFEKLLSIANRTPQLGALGTTLLYPDRKIQHIFLAPGIKILGAHPLKGLRFNPNWEWFQKTRPVAAVTGALLLTRPDNFIQVQGFDENLPTLGQDLDLCLKFQKCGLVNWAATALVCVHHEGKSRGSSIDFNQVDYMYRKWGDFLTANNYYSMNISRWSEYPSLRWIEGQYPWKKVIKF